MVDNQSKIHTQNSITIETIPPQLQCACSPNLANEKINNIILLVGLGNHQFTACLLMGPKLIKTIMNVNLTAQGAQIVTEVHEIAKVQHKEMGDKLK